MDEEKSYGGVTETQFKKRIKDEQARIHREKFQKGIALIKKDVSTVIQKAQEKIKEYAANEAKRKAYEAKHPPKKTRAAYRAQPRAQPQDDFGFSGFGNVTADPFGITPARPSYARKGKKGKRARAQPAFVGFGDGLL